MRSTFHNFDCHVGRVFEIFGEPDGREMPPSKFLYENVPVVQNLTDMAGVVAA